MNEATGKLIAREGLVIRGRDGTEFEMVRLKETTGKAWTSYKDGEELEGYEPETLEEFERLCRSHLVAGHNIGRLGLVPVRRTKPAGPENGVPAADVAAMAVDPKASQGDAKLGVHYVPAALVLHAAVAFTEGRQKYGPYKWRETKTNAMTYVGGALRHLLAYLDGEDIDPESTVGKHHLDGAIASLAILVDCMDNGTLVDDRPTKGKAGEKLRAPLKK